MKNKRIIQLLLIFLIVFCFSPFSFSTVSRKEIEVKLNSVSIPFIENRGQISKEVKFYARTFGGTVFITDDGNIIYSLSEFSKEKKVTKGVVIKEVFSEEKVIKNIKGEKKSITKVNIFKGKDSKKWLKNIPTFEIINLGEIHKGIELKVKTYGNNVEKIFYVKPGANPSDIKVEVKGAKEIEINKNGELILKTSPGEIKFTKPFAYQEIDGKRKYMNVSYRILSKNTYTFKTGKYDKNKTLIIDPLLASTFLGGSGDADVSNSIALDTDGNVFITGYTDSSDFPTTTGAYDTSYNSLADVFISKLNNDLSELVASTFLGGSGRDYAYSIALDTDGNVFVTGYTNSFNFPTTQGAYNTTYNGGTYDVFVCKLNNNLTQLSSSTFLGGSEHEEGHSIDTNGGVFVTGWTESADFPTTPGAYDTSHNGGRNVFISKFNNNLTQLSSSTFLGQNSYGESCSIDANGNVFITGWTGSSNFPTTPGAYDTTHNGGTYDVFVCKLNNNLTQLSSSTFLGGFIDEEGHSVTTDTNGNVFITGWTGSSNFPATAGAYDTIYNGGKDVFVSKFNNDLTQLSSSTFLGGNWPASPGGVAADEGYSIALDTDGNVFVTGRTKSSNFPVPSGAYDTTYNGGTYDVFVSKFNNNLSQLFSSTFLGGGSDDRGYSITTDTSGNVFITGWTGSSNFPTTPGAYDTTYSGNYWNVFVSKLDNVLSSDTWDTDSDGLADWWEIQYFGNLDQGPDNDPDNDGLTNLEEFNNGTNPTEPDTDSDGLPDGWEIQYGLNPNDPTGINGANGDPDNDGYTNLQEYQGGSNPIDENSIPSIKGDINGDGEVDISDVILCLRMAIGLDPVNLSLADMNDDGTVDISDVILVLRKAIGLD